MFSFTAVEGGGLVQKLTFSTTSLLTGHVSLFCLIKSFYVSSPTSLVMQAKNRQQCHQWEVFKNKKSWGCTSSPCVFSSNSRMECAVG